MSNKIADTEKFPFLSGGIAEGSCVVVSRGVPDEVELLSVGSEVLARCTGTGKISFKKILSISIFENIPTYSLYYLSSEGFIEALKATENQKIWIKGKGWTELRLVSAGDVVICCPYTFPSDRQQVEVPYTYDEVSVHAVTASGLSEKIYQLAIEDFHSLFISYEGLLITDSTMLDKSAAISADSTALQKAAFNTEVVGLGMETEIWMEGGMKRIIENMRPGIKVQSISPYGSEMLDSQVLNVFERNNLPCRTLNVKIGGLSHSPICAASSQLFNVKGIGWTKVSELKIGDLLLTNEDKYAIVSDIGRVEVGPILYNLTVRGQNAYFVGSAGLMCRSQNG